MAKKKTGRGDKGKVALRKEQERKGEAFLEENKKKEGGEKTPGPSRGLQYKSGSPKGAEKSTVRIRLR